MLLFSIYFCYYYTYIYFPKIKISPSLSKIPTKSNLCVLFIKFFFRFAGFYSCLELVSVYSLPLCVVFCIVNSKQCQIVVKTMTMNVYQFYATYILYRTDQLTNRPPDQSADRFWISVQNSATAPIIIPIEIRSSNKRIHLLLNSYKQ